MLGIRQFWLGAAGAVGLAAHAAAQPAAPPANPLNAPAPTPPAPSAEAQRLLAQASARGTEAERTAFPQVFGDLLGGGVIGGPLPVVTSTTGQILGQPIVVISPSGQRTTVNPVPVNVTPGLPAVDDLIRAPAAALPGIVPPPPVVQPIPAGQSGLFPPPGSVFDPSLAALVTRIPLFVRGAFKVTENDTPRPTTRAYATYNYYDQVYASGSVLGTPRIQLHQEVFGLEYAFADGNASLGVRLPYNQVVSPGLLSDTSLGDLTLISKFTLLENYDTGSLLSAGLALTIPSGQVPFASTTVGRTVRGTLIQPYLGHIYTWGDWFTQGFNSVTIPTDSDDAVIYANATALGYRLYQSPGANLSSVTPVAELHTNVPFAKIGLQSEPVGYVYSVTALGGVHFGLRDRATLGFAAGAPITGPRPFSLQATVQFNLRF